MAIVASHCRDHLETASTLYVKTSKALPFTLLSLCSLLVALFSSQPVLPPFLVCSCFIMFQLCDSRQLVRTAKDESIRTVEIKREIYSTLSNIRLGTNSIKLS